MNHNFCAFLLGVQRVLAQTRSGIAEEAEAPAHRLTGQTAPVLLVQDWKRFQNCSFARKCSSHSARSDSEQRKATFRFISSSDLLFCFYSFNGEGERFLFQENFLLCVQVSRDACPHRCTEGRLVNVSRPQLCPSTRANLGLS